MDDECVSFHGNFRWTGQPHFSSVPFGTLCFGCFSLFSVRFRLAIALVQPHPFGFLDLDDLGIVHHDFYHPVAERFDLLDDQIKPFRILRKVFRHIL
jgi:hypothetical protein